MLAEIRLCGCCLITDASVRALAENCKGLAEIDLHGCSKLTDASVHALAENCKGLAVIYIDGCSKITDAGWCSFKEALPKCRVVWPKQPLQRVWR